MADYYPLSYLQNLYPSNVSPEGYAATALQNPDMSLLARLGAPLLRGAVAPGQAYASTEPMTSEQMIGPAQDIMSLMRSGVPMAQRGAVGTFGGRPTSSTLAIKDAVAAAEPAEGMTRLFRGGSHLQGGGPKWVTTSQKYAEGYTTPGLAYHPKFGSYLQYVDVPASRVQIPPGQKVHSFEAPEDITSQLRPYYSEK